MKGELWTLISEERKVALILNHLICGKSRRCPWDGIYICVVVHLTPRECGYCGGLFAEGYECTLGNCPVILDLVHIELQHYRKLEQLYNSRALFICANIVVHGSLRGKQISCNYSWHIFFKLIIKISLVITRNFILLLIAI